MIRAEDVGLRDKKGASKQVGFRLPAEAIAYYVSEAASSGRSKVEVLVDSLFLERDLGRRLAPHRERLQRAAKAMGLELSFDLAEVLARLVEAQLDLLEPGRNKGVHD